MEVSSNYGCLFLMVPIIRVIVCWDLHWPLGRDFGEPPGWGLWLRTLDVALTAVRVRP